LRNAWLICRREYIERVHTRAFVISTILVPAFMFVLVMLPQKLIGMKAGTVRKIVLVTSSAETGAALQAQIASADSDANRRFNVTLDLNTSSEERQALREKVARNEIDGFLWASDEAVAARKVNYTGREMGDFMDVGIFRRAISATAIRRGLREHGIPNEEAEALLKPIEVDAVQVAAGKETHMDGPAVFLMAVVQVVLLYTTLLMYGVSVMRSVIEEKSSRIVEVLLASATPQQLMIGKILGVGAAGLTQAAIWATAGAIFSAPAMFAMKSIAPSMRIPLPALIAFPVFFLLGYLLFSCTFAALGAAVNSEQEAQQFQTIVILPIVLPMILMTFVIREPNAPLSVALSLFPLTAPILMYLRILVRQPPAWQIATSIGLLLLAIWGLVSLAARIYRVGILMYGKRPTLPEIIKWVKFA
jgi:ABC-2 type transport system permease protein